MSERAWHSNSAEETIAIGAEIAQILSAPALVLLTGPLGAGKTTLMKGIVKALGDGQADDVTSPTFTLVHEYSGAGARVFHLDLYRLETQAQVDNLGIEEMLSEPDSLVFVEWGERFPALAAIAGAVVTIACDQDARTVTLAAR